MNRALLNAYNPDIVDMDSRKTARAARSLLFAQQSIEAQHQVLVDTHRFITYDEDDCAVVSWVHSSWHSH